jgi:YfiH family protein
MSAPAYARVYIKDIEVVALSRSGGQSSRPFDSLNLAPYVGDDAVAVTANQTAVKTLVGADGISVMNAEHGCVVNVVTKSGLAPAGDGLVSTTPNFALLALAADCVPFAVADPVNRVIAVGHAGWRGVLANVMQSVLDAFVAQGGNLQSAQAVIGPSICANCYEVPNERVALFRGTSSSAIADEFHLDLSTGVKSVLLQSVSKVHQIPGCTFEDTHLFSYRRANGAPTGRGGLVIVMPSS